MRNGQSVRLARTIGMVFGALLLALPALAEHPDTSGEIENLKRRIEVLEAERQGDEDAPFSLFGLGKRLSFSGLLELEGSYAKPEGGDEESDLTLATAQLEVSAAVNEHISGNIVLLYEEEEGEDDDIEVDEALMTLTCPVEFMGGELSMTGGKLYVPFGHFASHLITDPLTLDLGETNDTALYVGWEKSELLALKAGVFNGEADTDGDNQAIDSFVASVEVTPAKGVSMGASYLSDLAESDIELARDAADLGNVYRSSVPGVGAFVSLEFGDCTFEGEYLAATRSFSRQVVAAAGEDEGELTGRRPRAWNLELAYAPLEHWEFALRGEGARDFQDDLTRYGAAVSHGLLEHVVVGLEYLRGDGKGEDNDPSHTVTGQLAFEF